MNEAPIASHPDADLLRRFGSGQLRGAEAESVEAHLETCAACGETLRGLGDDSFVGLVRQAGSQAEASGNTLPAVLPEATLPAVLEDHPRYRVLDLLGKGGMGAVYRAEHRLMGRTVALKVLSGHLTARPEVVERFRAEVRAAAVLSHPNIVQAHDADSAGDVHFLVMEHVCGTDLARLVAERGPLGVADACRYVRMAALGLQHALEHGMTHRDVKPHNLMLDSDGVVKVLDFGLARLLQAAGEPAPGMTAEGVVLGTVEYMAPEQADDPHAADARSDVYSLGCTLYHLLAGRVPFPEGNALQRLKAHAEKTATPIRDLRPDVPEALAAVLARLMARDPADRYQTPAEAAAALAPFTVPPPAPVARRRRRRLAVAVAVLLLLAPLAALAAVVFRFQSEHGELAVTIDDPNVKVVVSQNGQLVEIIDSKTGKTLPLRPGEYDLGLKGPPGFQLDVRKVVIRRGKTALATVERKPPAPDIKPLDRGEVKPPATAEDKQPPGLVMYLPGLGGPIDKPALSPDGRYCAVAPAGNGFGSLYYLRTKKELGQFRSTGLVAFPGDGTGLVSILDSNRVGLYRVPSLERERIFPDEIPGGASELHTSPDGRHVLAWGRGRDDNKGFMVWDARTGKTVLERSQRAVFSPDGKQLLTFSRSGKEVEVFDLQRSEPTRRFPNPGSPWALCSLALLPGDREAVLWNTSTRVAEFWHVATGKLARQLALGPTWINDWYPRAVVSGDGKRMLTSHDDGFVRLWDVTAGREIWRAPVEVNVRGLTFSRNGRYAAAGSGRGELYVWRLPDRPGPLPRHDDRPEFRNVPGLERGHVWNAHIYHSAWSPDGRHYLATGASNNQVRIWNAATGELVRVVPGWQWAAFTPDGKQVLAASTDNSLRLWELKTGREVRRLEGHVGCPVAFDISTDGKRVLSGSLDRTLRLWDLSTGKELARQPHPFPPVRPVFSPDGKRALSHDGDRKAHLWEVDGLRLLRTYSLPRKEAFQLLGFLPGSREFVVVSPTTVRWFAVDADGERRSRLLKTSPGDSSEWWALSHDSTRLVMNLKSDGAMRILELPSGKELARIKTPARLFDWWGHVRPALSPDGRRLVVPACQGEVGRVYVFRLPAKE
jgi:WD40 repeat protein